MAEPDYCLQYDCPVLSFLRLQYSVLSVTHHQLYGLNILTLGRLDQEAENHRVDFHKKTARQEIPHLRAHSRPRPFLECLGQCWPDGTGEVGVVMGVELRMGVE